MDSYLWSEESIRCPICQNTLSDPTTLQCGHNFCIKCITNCWDMEIYSENYSCPQCKETLTTRPTLNKNTVLARMVDKLRKTGLQDSPPANRYVRPGEVPCDVHTASKFRAVRSFLEANGQSHLQQQAKGLQEMHCPHHNKRLDIYCRDDGKCICNLCKLAGHKEHNTVLAEEERVQRQSQLNDIQQKTRSGIEEREEDLEKLKEAMESIHATAQSAMEDSDRIFNKVIRCMEGKREEVKEKVRERERVLASQAERTESRLKHEISTLKKRATELETLSRIQEDILFLQRWQSVSSQNEPGPLSRVTITKTHSFGPVKIAVNKLKDVLEDMCNAASENIEKTVTDVQLFKVPEIKKRAVRRAASVRVPGPKPITDFLRRFRSEIPDTRADFLQHACQLTLDLETANPTLHFSEENRKVTASRKTSKLKNHHKRFDCKEQVLCLEGLTGGRCYWEVEWAGKGVFIGVALESISRKGRGVECGLGRNTNSWSLHCSASSCSAWHNNVETEITIQVSSPRVGVYFDHRAGALTFYSVSDTMNFLHRFTSENFSEPLYPGFGLGPGSSVRLCQLEQE